MSANDELQAHTCEKILQEHGNVANNVANEKVQDLTEAWKKGELEWHKSYYCQNKKGDFCMATLMGTDVLYSKELGATLNFGYWEVLAPVPSYEEWKIASEQLNKNGVWYSERSYKELKKEKRALEVLVGNRDNAIQELREENAKLKEDYNRLGKLLQKMEDSDNAREKFQNGQIEKLKELLKNITDESDIEKQKALLKINKLAGLLKECRKVLELVKYRNAYNISNPTYGAEYLLAKIDEALNVAED